MTRITVAKGDGIGPEIMNATLAILRAADAQTELDEIEVGEQVYFLSTHGKPIDKGHIIRILSSAFAKGIDTIKTENLYAFAGKPAFSMGLTKIVLPR